MKEWSADVMKYNKVQRLDGVFQTESRGKKGEMQNRQKQGIRSRYSLIILSSSQLLRM